MQTTSCRDWWPWSKPDYITMTRKQSNNQWSGGIAAQPAPKNSECKNSLEISRLDFLGSRPRPPHWLSSKGSNYQRGVLLISAGAIEGHFERKTPREGHQGSLVLARQCPGSPDTCNPEETGLSGLPMSSSHSILRIWPLRTTTCSLDWKNKWKWPFLSDAEVIPAAVTWLDGQHFEFFLSGSRKLEQRAKKCIDLRGECVE